MVSISSLDELLLEDEEVDETVNPSRTDSRYLKRYLLAGGLSIIVAMLVLGANSLINVDLFLAIPLILAPLLLAVEAEAERKCVMYHFTDNRVLVEKGLLGRSYQSIDYDNVTHLETEQAVQERIFGVSDMHLHAAGEQNEEIVLNGVKNAERFRKKVNQRS